MITPTPDLDDKIFHYILVGVTILVYHLAKAGFDWLGKKELYLVRRLFNKIRRRGD